MNRKTVDQITSDELDALHEELARVQANWQVANRTINQMDERAAEWHSTIHALREEVGKEIRSKHGAIAERDMALEGMEAARLRAEKAEAAIERVRKAIAAIDGETTGRDLEGWILAALDEPQEPTA